MALSRNAICCIETGRSPVPAERVQCFAEALRVPLRPFATFVLVCSNPDVAGLVWPGIVDAIEKQADGGSTEDIGPDDPKAWGRLRPPR